MKIRPGRTDVPVQSTSLKNTWFLSSSIPSRQHSLDFGFLIKNPFTIDADAAVSLLSMFGAFVTFNEMNPSDVKKVDRGLPCFARCHSAIALGKDV